MGNQVSPEWHKQYEAERRYDKDFERASGKNALRGGIDNPKNWRGGKWEMTHNPYPNRQKLDAKGNDTTRKGVGAKTKSASSKKKKKVLTKKGM